VAGRVGNLLRHGAENVARNGAGYAVAASALVLALTLLLSGVAISEGLKEEAIDAVRAGADLYCTWDRFGRDAAVPRAKVEAVAAIDGVLRVVPRIVGRATLGEEVALVLGVPLAELAAQPIPLQGSLPAVPADALIGCELARALELRPGSTIALESDLLRLFKVRGVVDRTASLWSAKAVVIDLEEAALVFGERDHVSDLCVDVRPGYEERVAEAIRRLDPRLRVQTQGLVEAYVRRGMTLREGVFTVLAALALALSIAAFAVVSWLGHAPRRREIALLKSEGWSTGDVLSMVAGENVLVSVFAAGLALLLAQLLVRGLGAPLVAPFFLPDLPAFPRIRVPARFAPLPAALSLLFSLVVTMTGSIAATWRTAITRPAEALR
jgi:ABC-type lipoprotein release transport system permease subunit